MREVHGFNIGEESGKRGSIVRSSGRDLDAVEQFGLHNDRHAHVAHRNGLECPEHRRMRALHDVEHVSVSSMKRGISLRAPALANHRHCS